MESVRFQIPVSSGNIIEVKEIFGRKALGGRINWLICSILANFFLNRCLTYSFLLEDFKKNCWKL